MDAVVVASVVVPETFVLPETVSAVELALPSVVCPVTFNVPFEVNEDVAVMLPPVKELMVEVTALNVDANRFVEVAFVDVRLVMLAVTMLAKVDQKFVAVRPV